MKPRVLHMPGVIETHPQPYTALSGAAEWAAVGFQTAYKQWCFLSAMTRNY